MPPSDHLPAPQNPNSDRLAGTTTVASAGVSQSTSKGQWQPTGKKSHNVRADDGPSMPADEIASREHLSFEAAVKAMQGEGALLAEEGEHLASCARCQSLVQNMRSRPIDSKRFAEWAAEYDDHPIPSAPTRVRAPARSAKSLAKPVTRSTGPSKPSR